MITAPTPQPHTYSPTDRAALAAGYRHLADLIESEQAPIPMNTTISLPVGRYGEDDDQAAIAAELRRALGGGRWDKHESTGGAYLYLQGMCGGLPIQLWMDRNAVCERVVVGTEEVTEVIPAVTEEDLRPEQTITRTVEHVEWRCSPLLAVEDTAEVSS